jgi:TolA-binding protein
MPFVSFEQQAISLLEQILKGVNDMTGEVERLRADVMQLTTVEQSAAALLAGLSQQIRDNLNDPTALAQIASDLESSTSELAAAVTANTPAQAAPADTSGAASTDAGAADGGAAAGGNVADPGALDPTVDAGPATDQAADHQADPPA